MSAPDAYLLDTKVVSETRKKKADAGVLAFLSGVDSSSLYLSVLTIGELRKGLAAKKNQDPAAGKSLAAWVEGLEAGFAERILGIDLTIARVWGEWSSDRPRPVIDTLLAATASVHGLTLVTRNTQHVRGLPVKVHDPWSG
ncbi:MAG TPA: type II toxin-antitoxin system VapC family toxin [Terracidiphilus sp.]